MISKESLNVFLVNIYKKCDTPQEKRLLECISYELNALIDEAQLQKAHYEKEIQRFKYIKTQPLLNALQHDKEDLIKKNAELQTEYMKTKKERDKYRNRWGQVKNLIKNENWLQDILKQADYILTHIDMRLDDVLDAREELLGLRESIRALMEENKND